jgi:hypothetical protein
VQRSEKALFGIDFDAKWHRVCFSSSWFVSAKELIMMNDIKHAMGAVGYSLLYLLVGGGLGGAILIFIIAKLLGH